MKLRFVFFISLFLGFSAPAAFAQEEEAEEFSEEYYYDDEEEAEEKALPPMSERPPIMSVGLSVDYPKLATFAWSQQTKWEFGVEVLTKWGLMPVAEYGFGSITPINRYQNANYRSEGNYWRAGMHYFIPYDRKSDFYFGVLYAQSRFSDAGTLQIAGGGAFPDLAYEFGRNNLEATWLEFVFGSEALSYKSFYFGWSLRYRRMLNFENVPDEAIPVASIPGFGASNFRNLPVVTLFIKYRLKFYKEQE